MKPRIRPVWLHYGAAATPKLLGSVTAIVVDHPYLWKASDEGRSVERFIGVDDEFKLDRQVRLDDHFDLPGKPSDEADVEALALADGRLWICGSHSWVRRTATTARGSKVSPRIATRDSRQLLGYLSVDGAAIAAGRMMPCTGPASLRSRLARNPFLAPFMKLPGKENGLDIEGLLVTGNVLMLGLRGPVVDNIALILEFELAASGARTAQSFFTHFVDLGGLGVRDLARCGPDVYILAGPVSRTAGPFRLYAWRPSRDASVQKPEEVHAWRDADEYPEGVACVADRDRIDFLVVYDNAAGDRIEGSRYRADRLTIRQR